MEVWEFASRDGRCDVRDRKMVDSSIQLAV